MLDSLYIGLTGLTSFSKSLNTISNNVANMNTPGYKARQLLFSDLYYRFEAGASNGNSSTPYSVGSGVAAGGEHLIFKQGDFRTTGNDLDVAIDGNGFLILRKNGEEVYTRDGQFEFDDKGILKFRGSEDSVLFLDQGGALVELSNRPYLTNPPQATTRVSFIDALSTNDATFNVNTSVIDSLGGTHTLVVTFTNNSGVTPGSWLVAVTENGNPLTNGEIRYSGGGQPSAGFDSISLSYQPVASGAANTLVMDFTGSNSFSASTSNIKVGSQNGYGAGALTKTTFDSDGTVVFTYSNGQKTQGLRLALASFGFVSGLEALGDNLFRNSSDQPRTLGHPEESLFGAIRGGSIEASNVDLAGQFSELIITQRGYQASSQVINAANEMLQQLLDLKSRR